MKRAKVFILTLSALLSATQVHAQSSDYQPDVLLLDGNQSYVFNSNNRLSIWLGGTIEFWAAPAWNNTPEYNPVILSNSGASGKLYEVSIRADKKAILLQSGDLIGEFAYNFTDETMHHVGLVNMGDQVAAVIDGQLIGAVSLKFLDLNSTEIRFGGSTEGVAPFTGAIASVRVWDKALEPETLVEFAWADSTSETSSHPNLEFLVGHSDFNTEDFYIIENAPIPSGAISDIFETGEQ